MKAWLMLLPLLAGCAFKVERPMAYDVWVTSDLSPNAIAGLESAFASWQRATGLTGQVHEGACPAGPTDVCVAEDLSVNGNYDGYEHAEQVTLYTNSVVDYAILYHKDSRTELQRIAAHELGHAFGLSHSAAGNVMAPNIVDMALEPTGADVEAFLGH